MKKYSLKFWIFFWTASAIFLSGWYLFWNSKTKGIPATVENVLNILPIKKDQKNEYQALATLGDFLLKKDEKQRVILILFQNNMEIRPGGGFIGAFGIVKILDGKVLSMETHDLSNFDARVPNIVPAPYPLQEIMKVKAWKFRDSNFSPEFELNAKKAEEFYRLGQGQENFDGVIGITSNVLTSILKITGPISIEGYPGTYDSNNAVLSLEYQVEKAFEEQGIERGERKSVMSDLAKEIEKKVFAFSVSEKIELTKILLADLNKKDIQLYFKDNEFQKVIADANWAGATDQAWNKDFLMTSDANLGSFKSDYYLKRSMDYTVDLSKEDPEAHLSITYQHTAKEKDWMTRNYTDYLRVYVPEGSWLTAQKNFDGVRFGNDLGKKYFGSIVRVPIDSSKTVELTYTLPKSIKEDYNLKIQKQAGLNNTPVTFHLFKADGTMDGFSKLLNRDIVYR